MPARKKPIPAHAYSFSASFLFAAISLLNKLMRGNEYLTEATFGLSILFALHGLYDLKKEHRLNKVLQPLNNKLFYFWETPKGEAVPLVELRQRAGLGFRSAN